MASSVDNESSISTIIVDAEPILDSMESPPSDRVIKVDLLDSAESPNMVQDFMDGMISDGAGDDDSMSSYELDIDTSEKSEDSHQSLQEMITKSLSQIEGVMGEILNETSSSSNLRRRLMKRNSSRDTITDDDDDIIPPPISLRTCSTMGSADMNLGGLQEELTNAEHEEKQVFKESVMANVERISTELEETRKSEEELKNRIDSLRGKLAQRRALRNKIVNASKVVEANVNSMPEVLKDKPKSEEEQEVREASEEFKSEELEDSESPMTLGNMSPTTRKKGSWLSFFRAKRRQQKEEEKREREQLQSMACRDADELISSFKCSTEEDDSSIGEEQQLEHQEHHVKVGRLKRFKNRSSWGSFIPASRMT
eukprot:CAMPEP_0113618054 /NCGR_PEP_ID=MMETSP0017_2-20120614/9127_1 /TAXON_ID=2856 /ORGANISM="Cylindrotheca closterium" /LENGTH=368 /DNA_ID=CAMNT_0000527527 /DNA_START=72 /DNA_END=1178 /DNA_ORIENTATION=+ /assembly_acc=CAM_ASM_000147